MLAAGVEGLQEPPWENSLHAAGTSGSRVVTGARLKIPTDRASYASTSPMPAPSKDLDGIESPLRIVFYSPRASHLEPALAHGGDPVFLHALFRALRERGHEVRVVSRLSARDVRRNSAPARRFIREALAIRKEVKSFSPHGWIVYNPSPTHPDLFCWWQGPRRYVILAAETWSSRRLGKGWRLLFAFAFRQSLRRADKVTAFRPAVLRRLRKAGVDGERLCFLPTGPELIDVVPPQAEARVRLDLPQDAPIVLCASRFTGPDERKQGKTEMILDLLSIVESLPSDVFVVLAGDGPGRSQIEAAVQALHLGNRVRILGAIENVDMTWVFAACDVYAQPHSLDGPWLSVFEAQACARPVVTMRTRSGELTVDDGRSGLLASTLDEFRDHLAALTSDRVRCAEMGQRARDFIVQFHSIDVRARQIEAFLNGR